MPTQLPLTHTVLTAHRSQLGGARRQHARRRDLDGLGDLVRGRDRVRVRVGVRVRLRLRLRLRL